MEISGFHGWLGPIILLAPLPTLHSEIRARILFLQTTQARGKLLGLFRVTGTEGRGVSESQFNLVLDCPVHFIARDVEAQTPRSSRAMAPNHVH